MEMCCCFFRVTAAAEAYTYPFVGSVRRVLETAISPGEKVAIVGRTGSGKSTLVQLLLRQFDASSGQITFDNVPLENINLHSLRSQIGYVPQAVSYTHLRAPETKANLVCRLLLEKKKKPLLL